MSCSEKKNKNLQSRSKTLSELNIKLKQLEKEKGDAQSFIESAEVHQVLRSKEEKAKQLDNLDLYKTKIELRIDSLRVLVGKYNDSIQGSIR
jgi:hypothetical protein